MQSKSSAILQLSIMRDLFQDHMQDDYFVRPWKGPIPPVDTAIYIPWPHLEIGSLSNWPAIVVGHSIILDGKDKDVLYISVDISPELRTALQSLDREHGEGSTYAAYKKWITSLIKTGWKYAD